MLVVVAALGALAWAALVDPEMHGCADVGLTTHASGSTPDDAMSAWVRSRGGDPAEWASGGERLENAFHPRTAGAVPHGYVEVAAREISPGVWRVTGGCVR